MYVIYNNILHDYELQRNKHRLSSPPRKQRIKSAVIRGRYEDISSLINIHHVKDDVKICKICGYTFGSRFLTFRLKFSCQLCNETYCSSCKSNVVLFDDVNVVSCTKCCDFYRKLQIIVKDDKANDDIINIFNTYKIVLEIYKDLNIKLLQLNGYIKLLSIHSTVEEPLPEGTRQSLTELLKETTISKKQLSEIKKCLKNANSHQCNITKYVNKSLNTLLTIILYKIIPEFNKVINKLTELEC